MADGRTNGHDSSIPEVHGAAHKREDESMGHVGRCPEEHITRSRVQRRKHEQVGARKHTYTRPVSTTSHEYSSRTRTEC